MATPPTSPADLASWPARLSLRRQPAWLCADRVPLPVKSSDLHGGVMTEQDPVGGDERVARLIQAARELIDAYERKSTANEHFLKLEAAVEALGGTSGQPRADQNPAAPPTTG